MIEIYGEKRGTRVRLYVTGHAAGGPEAGSVCAGVSALTGALADYAAACGNCRHLRVAAGEGSLFLSCHGGLGAAFDMVFAGLTALAESHPAYLTVASAIFGEGLPKKGEQALTTSERGCDTIGTRVQAPAPSDTAKERGF